MFFPYSRGRVLDYLVHKLPVGPLPGGITGSEKLAQRGNRSRTRRAGVITFPHPPSPTPSIPEEWELVDSPPASSPLQWLSLREAYFLHLNPRSSAEALQSSTAVTCSFMHLLLLDSFLLLVYCPISLGITYQINSLLSIPLSGPPFGGTQAKTL